MRAFSFKAQMQCSEASDFFFCFYLNSLPLTFPFSSNCQKLKISSLRSSDTFVLGNWIFRRVHSKWKVWAAARALARCSEGSGAVRVGLRGGRRCLWNFVVFQGWVSVHFYTWKKCLLLQRRCAMEINTLTNSQHFFQLFTLDVEVWSKRKRIRRKALCSDLNILNILAESLLPAIWTCMQAVEVCVVLQRAGGA